MKKTYKIFLTDMALENLELLPDKQIKKILDSIEHLEVFPEMGYSIQKPTWKEYRQLIIEHYRIIYRINEERHQIYIHMIQHENMNFK